MKKTGTPKQALSKNHKPEPHTRRRPSESTTLSKPLSIFFRHSSPSLVGCLSSSHAIGTQRDKGLAKARWFNISAL
uniref:Ovule protein n=1 Tax=Mesocestoides corti TaxID=53468 RepID=A0A5K3ETN5_MESCO